MEICTKIKRKWMKLRLQPIRVFCMHHVTKDYDEVSMKINDWMQKDAFKSKIQSMRTEGVKFISLAEAYNKISNDKFRIHKYAVLTFDDGYASQKEILPWLDEQHIPVTLFLNPAYLDGAHYRERETERYLTEPEVHELYKHYQLLTIGSHGWEHLDATKQSKGEFEESVRRTDVYLRKLPNYIPFFAFTYGYYTQQCVDFLRNANLVPLTVKGGKNYIFDQYIDRELL